LDTHVLENAEPLPAHPANALFQPGGMLYIPTFNPPATLQRPASSSDLIMAKSKKKAEVVFLVCEETGDYNYVLRRKPGGEKLKLKKYSPRLRKHTVHNEKKK
jgi:large subunit ribosomal protein L33